MKPTRLLAVLTALVLVLAACNGEAQEEPTTTAADGATTTAADGATTTAGEEPGEEEPADGESLLDEVAARGSLVCGVNDSVPGFGFVGDDGTFSGFDIEFCRAVAAAVLGDSEAVEFRVLTAAERFTALQTGEIDVLIRNTTYTATRDGTEGATFLTTTYYDGQGMMVRADSGFASIDDMANTDICVLQGTTTELNITTLSQARGLDMQNVTFEDNSALQAAFEAGQCDGWTSDRSQLAGVRSQFPEGPEALTIFDEVISKEPLGPVTRDGDDDWSDAVDWAVIATIQAEEFGIDSTNVDDFMETDDPEIARFLGLPDPTEGTVFDPGLGLATDFAQQVIRQVGNYAEIYERNVGADGLGLERGFNALWTDGGLHYPPPYR
jgi:general L-amino acid transport system substrate-binding protein